MSSRETQSRVQCSYNGLYEDDTEYTDDDALYKDSEDSSAGPPTLHLQSSPIIPIGNSGPLAHELLQKKHSDVNTDETNEYIKDPLEKRKYTTTQLILEIMNKFFYVKDKDALKLLFKSFSHMAQEFSDIDWTSVATMDSKGGILTVNTLLIQCEHADVLSVFLDNNLIDPCTPDVNGKSLEDLVNELDSDKADFKRLRFINIINKKILAKQKNEIATLQNICSNSSQGY